jgi:hypothetical protein
MMKNLYLKLIHYKLINIKISFILMEPSKIQFDYHSMPHAYLCDNVRSNSMREQFIKNQTKITECDTGVLANVFFSDENMELINRQLIYSIWKNTNGEFKINNQSKEKLIIVMRYIFIEYARHLPYDVKGQIKELNCRVVTDIVPNIITNIQQYVGYLKDIEKIRDPLPLPISTKTTRMTTTLPSTFNPLK